METSQYSELPARTAELLQGSGPAAETLNARLEHFASMQLRIPDKDGYSEVLDGVTFVHHFVKAPGDYDLISWHYVEAGEGEPIVFLHGIPSTWYMWHHQMAGLASTHRCIGVDLKGYGQSEKTPGDYTHEGAAEQLYAMLLQIGVDKFNLVSHDRGTVQADFIAAKHPNNILRYGRGEQHLYHFNPSVAPQEEQFRNAPWTGIMEDPKRLVLWAYTWLAVLPIPDNEMIRIIQEWSYPDISRSAQRYFLCSTFRNEWLARRRTLLKSWICPVLIMQGFDSKTEPREWYEKAREYIPNSPGVLVDFLPGGHFWAQESPEETTGAIRKLLQM
ncbi:hypothetical protein H2204_009977 [Knufia peltigerae]|uniref:AB hydrolase-1 domain-containing protein n=1 Tax=Knufia peltigerae TaxID=1002370 RepID=A0AA38XXY3_9EURO|nr:hypothetical protein H2204_009977 [Knufia peltigerae]